MGDHLRLHIEFILGLSFAVLFGGPPPKHLHGFAGYPIVLKQKYPQVADPGAGKFQPLLV